jgi:hypothetical protein
VQARQSKGGNGGSVLPPWLEESEREAEVGVNTNVASWCSRGIPGPDRWAHGRRTNATARPCGGTSMWSVGH